MFKALVTRDGKEEHLSVYDTPKDTSYTAICPGCKDPVRANRGAKKQHYWSHIPGAVCSYGAGMTEWHYNWQKIFDGHPTAFVEAYNLFPNNRPDLLIEHDNKYLVVEFQNSPISVDTIKEREKAYCSDLGGLVWIVNSRTFTINKRDVWLHAKCPVIFDNDGVLSYKFNGFRSNNPKFNYISVEDVHRSEVSTLISDLLKIQTAHLTNILVQEQLLKAWEIEAQQERERKERVRTAVQRDLERAIKAAQNARPAADIYAKQNPDWGAQWQRAKKMKEEEERQATIARELIASEWRQREAERKARLAKEEESRAEEVERKRQEEESKVRLAKELAEKTSQEDRLRNIRRCKLEYEESFIRWRRETNEKTPYDDWLLLENRRQQEKCNSIQQTKKARRVLL